MYNKLRFFFIAMAAFLPALAAANMFSVSEQEINAYLSKKVEINDKFGLPGLFGVDYSLRDLSVQIGRKDNKRVELSGVLSGLFSLPQKEQFAGQLNLTIDTIPYYDPEQGAVYLKDIRILQWSGSPQKYMNQLQTVMPFLSKSVAALMEHIPIYKLDESKARDVLIKKFAKGIRVEEGALALDAGVL
ncbi:uncharacterized protein DUF1439 [Mesocricetibacter intestinalis]|uniref:Uncharacterized protein DUF1439 n=1 Tax=Mesocricetibacter intestinalis TaxID=1521930 RepID=A0A4R6V777_9PAST|nr:DUF1439 domain-containing protein [Mesocricetibacter intestinalis]TDQ57213.1 uncharacterized protein DUF1439 [Mesocricetibacter intestinalis]